MDKEIKFGNFDISLPDEVSSMFGIFENLTGFLGVEYQSDAVAKLQIELKKANLKPKPNIDFESDYTQIESKSADTIFNVAKIINNISEVDCRVDFKKEELDDIFKRLKAWKRPQRQKWEIGDILSVPMQNGSFAFGQIVGTHLTKTSPILALFDLVKNNTEISAEELKKAKAISVYNSDEDEIKNHFFTVLFNYELLVSPEKVRNKGGYEGADLSTLANIYFGLEPWNVMYEEDYYDNYFLPEIERPKNILWLNIEERNKYRREKYNIDENNNYIK
jgi:hypothetical protein